MCVPLPGTGVSRTGPVQRQVRKGETGPSPLASASCGSRMLGARGGWKSRGQLCPVRTGRVLDPREGLGAVPEKWLPVAAHGGHSLGLGTRLVVCCGGRLSGPTWPRILRTPRCGCEEGGVPVL